MASVFEASRAASKSRPGRSGGFFLSALLTCGVVAGSMWAAIATLGAMQDAAESLSSGKAGLVAPLKLPAVSADGGDDGKRLLKIAKFSRLSPPSESEMRQKQLTAEAIQASHQRNISIRLANAVKREKEKAMRIEVAFARAERTGQPADAEEKIVIPPQTTMLTALVEDVSARGEVKPFDLVMPKPEAGSEQAILGTVPLPEARPALESVAVERKPAEEKPAARRTTTTKKKDEVAYAKPDRSLFGDLFKGGDSGSGWPGRGTKVAIYDVSGATVYMPDGTKLRAHSGIGKMRDNPKFSHVKMRGATPAGIYRLTMRERRFHGVEALRMTSIDGRHPKNRTGLLTHTNLLRGQIGSHGCVAFQNYDVFLNAFKRGKINMLVVVDEMPSSRNQVAAIYRKAGA